MCVCVCTTYTGAHAVVLSCYKSNILFKREVMEHFAPLSLPLQVMYTLVTRDHLVPDDDDDDDDDDAPLCAFPCR